jgi:hypothetical protein
MAGDSASAPGPHYGSEPGWTAGGPLTPELVREHVRRLRARGGSYEAIAHAAGLGAMTVHAVMNSDTWILPSTADALLAVTAGGLELRRIDAGSTRLRLRSLVAMGHGSARLARALGVHPETVQRLVRGEAPTVNPELHARVSGLFDAWWDKRPPECTRHEQAAAETARRRAERNDWCCPMALDEDQLDEPGYQPLAGWRPAIGTGTAHDVLPPRCRIRAAREAHTKKEVSTVTAIRKLPENDAGRPATADDLDDPLRKRLEAARRAGAEEADIVILAQANAGMSPDQIDASVEYVLAGQHDTPVTPVSVAFDKAYRQTAAAYVADLRELDRPSDRDTQSLRAQAGQPHPDPFLASRGWHMSKHGVYLRRAAAPAADLEAG